MNTFFFQHAPLNTTVTVFRLTDRKCQNSCAGQGWGFEPRRAAAGSQALIGGFETAGIP